MLQCALLVPCYNAEPYIEKFWSNIEPLKNNFNEIIILDDASTDNSLKHLKKLPVEVIKSTHNMGPGAARNKLAEKAASEWLYFFDIDDRILPEFGSRMLANNLSGFDVLVGDVDWVDQDYGSVQIARRYNNDLLSKDPLRQSLTNLIGVIGAVIKKESFHAINGFREDIRCWEDADLFVRLAAAGARFRAIEEVIAHSIRHSLGISNDQLGCASCRLELLRGYIETLPESHRAPIAEQLEQLAWTFVELKDHRGLRATIELASLCGRELPVSNSIFIKYAKSLLSPEKAFRIQQFFRKL